MRLSPIETLESRRLLSGTVVGMVYNDLNGSGTINPGEPGLVGIKVFEDLKHTGLYAAGDPYVLSGANGDYAFPLKAGTYDLNVQVPAGFQHTYPYTGKDDVLNVVSGDTYFANNFGLTTAVHVAGTVYVNTNGHITTLPNVKLSVAPAAGGSAFVRSTGPLGTYGIGGLPFGKAYKVTLTLPAGYMLASGSLSQTTPILASGKDDNAVNFTLKPIVILSLSKRYVQLTWGYATPLPSVTQTAIDNTAFNGSVSGSKQETFQTEEGSDTILVDGSAKQKSTISTSEFTDNGTTAGDENDSAGGGTSFAQGESYFSETFTLNAAVHYSLAANFSTDSPYDNMAQLSFKGPGTASVFPTVNETFSDDPISVNHSGTLAAGTYTVTFIAKAYDNNGNMDTANYTFDLKL